QFDPSRSDPRGTFGRQSQRRQGGSMTVRSRKARGAAAAGALAVTLVALTAGEERGSPGWSWPVEGSVLTRYSNDDSNPYAGGLHRGVDIAAAVGTPVNAARAGQGYVDRWRLLPPLPGPSRAVPPAPAAAPVPAATQPAPVRTMTAPARIPTAPRPVSRPARAPVHLPLRGPAHRPVPAIAT